MCVYMCVCVKRLGVACVCISKSSVNASMASRDEDESAIRPVLLCW